MPQGSPLAAPRPKPPTLREIVELPLIGYRSCRTTEQVEERLRVAGREPHVVFRSDDNYTVQGMVAAGIGVALVPLLTVDPSDDRIVVVDLGDRVPARLIGIAWHATGCGRRPRARSSRPREAALQALRQRVARRLSETGISGSRERVSDDACEH